MVTAEDGSLRIYKINISFEDVLDDNAVDLAAPYIRHHLMKGRTVVVHTGITVVGVSLDNLDIGVLRKESVSDFCLIADGIAFGIVAVLHG